MKSILFGGRLGGIHFPNAKKYPHMKLKDAAIRSIKPKDKPFKVSDGHGLFLFVTPTGSKLWRFKFRLDGKEVTLSFGIYPDITLAEARKKRDEARQLIAHKKDPREHKKEQQAEREAETINTFEKIAVDWFEIKKTKITAKHAIDIWRSIERDLLPTLGKIPVIRLKAKDCIDTLRPMEARGIYETVKRHCQRINEIMTYAVNIGLIQINPAANIGQGFVNPQKKHMPSIEPSQLNVFMRSLSQASIRPITRYLIEWQLHTMTRPSEAAGARWSEIHMLKREWHIPPERMKKRRPHIIPLSKQAMIILQHMQSISGTCEFVFPSIKDCSRPMNSSSVNVAIKRMGYGGKLVAHGFRSIASTALNEKGFNSDWIETALAHVSENEVRNAYNRALYLEQRKGMMQWWSDFIDAASQGSLSVASAAAC